MSELQNFKSRIEELESDLRERDDEVKTLKDQNHQSIANGGGEDGGETLKVLKFRQNPTNNE